MKPSGIKPATFRFVAQHLKTTVPPRSPYHENKSNFTDTPILTLGHSFLTSKESSTWRVPSFSTFLIPNGWMFHSLFTGLVLFISCINFYPSNTFRHATETRHTYVAEGSRLSYSETLLHAQDMQTRTHACATWRIQCNIRLYTECVRVRRHSESHAHNYSLQHFPSITLQLDIFRGTRPIWEVLMVCSFALTWLWFTRALETFAKLLKKKWILASLCLSVCASVRVEQLGSQWTDFHEIWYPSIIRKSVEKIQVSLKSDKNNSYKWAWRPIHIFYHISLNSSWNEKCFRKQL